MTTDVQDPENTEAGLTSAHKARLSEFHRRRAEGALARETERHAEEERIADIALRRTRDGNGRLPFDNYRCRERVGQIITIGRNHIVEILEQGHDTIWRTVVNDKVGTDGYWTPESAMLGLFERVGSEDGREHGMAYAAGRVLLISFDKPVENTDQN